MNNPSLVLKMFLCLLGVDFIMYHLGNVPTWAIVVFNVVMSGGIICLIDNIEKPKHNFPPYWLDLHTGGKIDISKLEDMGEEELDYLIQNIQNYNITPEYQQELIDKGVLPESYIHCNVQWCDGTCPNAKGCQLRYEWNKQHPLEVTTEEP